MVCPPPLWFSICFLACFMSLLQLVIWTPPKKITRWPPMWQKIKEAKQYSLMSAWRIIRRSALVGRPQNHEVSNYSFPCPCNSFFLVIFNPPCMSVAQRNVVFPNQTSGESQGWSWKRRAHAASREQLGCKSPRQRRADVTKHCQYARCCVD